MDKDTRDAIRSATQRVRALLDEDFSLQLEGTFDVLRSGAIALNGGAHLSARNRFQRDKIIAAIDHKRAAGMTAEEAVADYVRDAAFTTLNRFVALKMLEARELVQECITKGEKSAGYREFCGMAPGIVLLPDAEGYRLYVESLFDEFSTEIKVLFDRRDSASVLWPKRPTFESLLTTLNASDLSKVWGDDETIGWVYQFFNSREERQLMRASQKGGSQAPRNRREMAVRNQFFTPRYVVRFLVDNTLGRLWLEMHGNESQLRTLCEYHLVGSDDDEFPLRPKKDPRDLRILDPACGSGHFLLYSFDLLLAMYEEAWSVAEGAPRSESTGRTLREDFSDFKDFRREVPRLIIEHNLHGVDIDPRCAQIAALALWLRAQRAWKELGIASSDRPRVRRTHIVGAEPMLGDPMLLNEFAARLDPPLLRELFKKMARETNLAGELGTLLRLEDRIADELRRAREQFVKQRQTSGFLPGFESEPKQASLDLSGIDDDTFFQEAEAQIVDALRDFAEATSGGAMRRRLFADDAFEGIALIDLTRHRFDVILMNPPFGDPSVPARKRLDSDYLAAKHDIASAFLERAIGLLAPQGLVGAIVTRTIFFLQYLREWREKFLLGQTRISIFADMGIGVLDAMVETSLICLRRKIESEAPPTHFITANREGERENRLKNSDGYRTLLQERLTKIPGCPLAFSISDEVLELFGSSMGIEAPGRGAFTGALTQDDFRFVRAWWEVSIESISRGWTSGTSKKWVPYVSGGSHNPIYADVRNIIRWEEDGEELKAFLTAYRGAKGFADQWTSQLNSYANYFRPGIVWSLRPLNQGSFWFLPEGCIFGNNAPALLVDAQPDLVWIVGVLNSAIFRAILGLLMPRGNTGTSTLKYNLGYVRSVPLPTPSDTLKFQLNTAVAGAWEALRNLDSLDETSHAFAGVSPECNSLAVVQAEESRLQKAFIDIEDAAGRLYGVSDAAEAGLLSESGVSPCDQNLGINPIVAFARRSNELFYRVEFLVGVVFGRWPVAQQFGEQDRSQNVEIGSMPTFPAALEKVRWATSKDIAVQDSGHADDLSTAVLAAAQMLGDGVLIRASDEDEVRRLLQKDFFRRHIAHYSTSTRAAPIYWQLATPSANYSVWIYVHSINSDTIFRIQKDYVIPKLNHELAKLEGLQKEFGDKPSASDRRLITAQASLVEEIQWFLDGLRQVASLFHPNLDDGVIINFSPLWALTAHQKSWQKELKSTWDRLCDGEYDWTHLSMHLWPERVVTKCAADRSLAIAHGLEAVFWVKDDGAKWKPRPRPTRPIAELVRERSSVAVKAALESLTKASAPSGPKAKARRSLS
ncbi:BREX-1 system adenine-specific DNA-methyltransferase PglX [Bradyrhizobium yuanmingense]|uniref:BREX-1 system adenine-specific DNA-methyltransferase PglX n=1 Tax=Bradyrhizobium yuanmingense TaxID=108015 RepID=UPI00351383AC